MASYVATLVRLGVGSVEYVLWELPLDVGLQLVHAESAFQGSDRVFLRSDEDGEQERADLAVQFEAIKQGLRGEGEDQEADDLELLGGFGEDTLGAGFG